MILLNINWFSYGVTTSSHWFVIKTKHRNISIDSISNNSTKIEYLSIQKCRSNYLLKLSFSWAQYRGLSVPCRLSVFWKQCWYPRAGPLKMSANDVGVLKRSRPGLHLRAIDRNCHPGFGAGSIEKQDWLRPVPRTDHRIKGAQWIISNNFVQFQRFQWF